MHGLDSDKRLPVDVQAFYARRGVIFCLWRHAR